MIDRKIGDKPISFEVSIGKGRHMQCLGQVYFLNKWVNALREGVIMMWCRWQVAPQQELIVPYLPNVT